jgi:tetratricopeptide (TPR) repeat protein
MKPFSKRLMISAFVLLSISAVGSRYQTAFGQETDDPVKIDMYKKFYDNRNNNQSVAYVAAQDYLKRYSKDKDQYVDYLQKWVMFYERDERKRRLPGLINEKNFAEAYSVGAKILADEPNYLRTQIDLGYAGYLAASAKNETYNADALGYARKAIQAIASGVTPSEWAPFKGKDDTLAYLHYSVGFLTLKTNPDQAIDSFLKAAQLESDIKKNPRTYYALAAAYESGPYKVQSAAFQTAYGDKPETPASKAALEKVNVLIDRIIDAYARAIALANTDPSMEQSRKEWLTPFTNYYKFRHGGSDAGLTEYIAAALSRPLPPKP